jgi:hypothetical protein
MLTELKYRTFNQLLEDVSVDFSMYALENMIEPQQLIKVVQRVNYDLGLRINMTKEVVLDIVNSCVVAILLHNQLFLVHIERM